MHLSIVLPEMIWPEPGDRLALEELACPGLEWLLAHGHGRRQPPRPYEQVLAGLFGLDETAPFGPLRLLGEAGAADPGDGCWLCADPVHLRFHHERIVLADAGAFELELEEALALAEGLNGEFADIGRFHVAHPRRWYLRLETPLVYPEQPLSAVAGRRVAGDLPAGTSKDSAAARLRAWLNEVQMFLHGHPVNERRQAAGQPAVNSLWLWGGGHLPQPADPGFDNVWTGDPLGRGLAQAAGIVARPRPESLDALLAHTAAGSSHLVIIDDLLGPVLYEDSRGWHQTVEALDRAWFSPLRAGLGRIASLRLVAPTVYGLLEREITAGERFKFWRRPLPLARLAHTLAEEPLSP